MDRRKLIIVAVFEQWGGAKKRPTKGRLAPRLHSLWAYMAHFTAIASD